MRDVGIPAYRFAAVVFVGHAVWALRGAWWTVTLPIEAGGIILAPLIGLPLFVVACGLLALAVGTLFAWWLPWPVPAGALLVLAAADAFLVDAIGAFPPAVVALVGAVAALALVGHAVATGRVSHLGPGGRARPPAHPAPPPPYLPGPSQSGPYGGPVPPHSGPYGGPVPPNPWQPPLPRPWDEPHGPAPGQGPLDR